MLNYRSKILSLLVIAGCTSALVVATAQPRAKAAPGDTDTADSPHPLARRLAWQQRWGAVRGVTVGPIESALHPGVGYGSGECASTMADLARLGARWVSLTPFGRTWDLEPTGVDASFEQPFQKTQADVRSAVAQAHAAGLRVMLVPHLWVETGGWRALVDPPTDAGWARWADAYERWLLEWARVAEQSGVELLSVGVEQRSWVTTTHAPRFKELIARVRSVYGGALTYGANWDDADDTVVWEHLDLIGINAFYPLAAEPGATPEAMRRRSGELRHELSELSLRWDKPVLFTEIGYTTRPDPALRPWEWPDGMIDVVVDEVAQAHAYQALLSGFVDAPWFAGFFVWRVYSDRYDMSQEAEWGFSPRGKLAELVMRDAFAAHWAADGPRPVGRALQSVGATQVGRY